jgi:hypothetical protein
MYSEVFKQRHKGAEAFAVLGIRHGWAAEGEGEDLVDAGWGTDGEDGVDGPGVVGGYQGGGCCFLGGEGGHCGGKGRVYVCSRALRWMGRTWLYIWLHVPFDVGSIGEEVVYLLIC